jgi:antitoxin MazE
MRRKGDTMLAQVKAWGNSQGIRIPQEILKETKIKTNDFLEIEVVNDEIVLRKKNRHLTLAERIAKAGGTLEHVSEYDWGEPVGREVW